MPGRISGHKKRQLPPLGELQPCLRGGRLCSVLTLLKWPTGAVVPTMLWKEYFEDLLNPTNMPSGEEAEPGSEVAKMVKKIWLKKVFIINSGPGLHLQQGPLGCVGVCPTSPHMFWKSGEGIRLPLGNPVGGLSEILACRFLLWRLPGPCIIEAESGLNPRHLVGLVPVECSDSAWECHRLWSNFYGKNF